MIDLEKSIYIGSLFNFYKKLLTPTQQQIGNSYYCTDLGLTEIANNLNISRQAVLDSIKKTEKKLIEFENKLHLNKIFTEQEKLIEQYKKTNKSSYLNKIISLWED